jgi:hypothetical protein
MLVFLVSDLLSIFALFGVCNADGISAGVEP